MRSALGASAVVAIAIGLTAPALSEGTPEPTTPTAQSNPCAYHQHPATEQRRLARRAWAFKRWQDPTPATPAQLRTMRRLRHCAVPEARAPMSHSWRAAKRGFYRNRAYRQIAPYPGFSGEGYWLRWLPIPAYIVSCETNGYHGDGRWLAANPSGANGPAQLLGWGQPYPADTDRERLAYWRITRKVWLSSGPGAWQCA